MKAKNIFFILTVLSISVLACKSSDPEIDNPFDKDSKLTEHSKVNGDSTTIDNKTIQGLHKNIFKPTCANSGCHDGNFEPDFRTIESSYNTMVNQPIIKNDELNPLQARVSPGSPETSMLILRLEKDLNNASGIMPLAIEPNSDWKAKKETYIQDVKDWINNGALNQKGESPNNVNFPPQLGGIIARVNGNIISRLGRFNPIPIPTGTSNFELWFSYNDDNTTADQLLGAKANFSMESHTFDSTKEQSLQYVSTPIVSEGYAGEDVDYHFKITVNTSLWGSGDIIWIRSKIGDGALSVELPNDNSLFNSKKYAAFILK